MKYATMETATTDPSRPDATCEILQIEPLHYLGANAEQSNDQKTVARKRRSVPQRLEAARCGILCTVTSTKLIRKLAVYSSSKVPGWHYDMAIDVRPSINRLSH